MALSRRIVSGVETHKDQWLNDAISRILREVADELILSYGVPTLIHYADHNAVLGSLDINDPSGGGFTINLPSISRKDVGKCITICNISLSPNPVVVRCPGGSINGLSSISVGRPNFLRQAMALDADADAWLLTAASDGGTGVGEQPWWEWNSIDTSQFSTIVEGANVASSSLAVVNLAGKNWLKFTVSSNTNVVNMFPRCAVAPINVTPPSANYRITYDYACSDFDTGNLLVQGVVGRWGAATHTGNYYCGFIDNSGSRVRCSYVINGANAAPNFREEAIQIPYASTADWHSGEFIVRDESLVWADMLSAEVGFIESAGAYTAAGQPGLIAGTDNIAATRTVEALYSNIKCWEVT